MNTELLRNIIIIIVIVVIVMVFLQSFLDKRRISYHSLIRNITIVFSIYYLMQNKWNWLVFFLPFITELIIELLSSNCILNLDPEENKTINCYNWFEKVSEHIQN
jgi:hypothetical protein